MLRRLARARQELSLSHGQTAARDPRLLHLLRTRRSLPTSSRRVADRLTVAYKEQSAFFGATLRLDTGRHPLRGPRVLLARLRAGLGRAASSTARSASAMDPDQGVTPALEGVLAHELAHALIRKVSGDRAPGWLHEGLAQWARRQTSSAARPARDLHRRAQARVAGRDGRRFRPEVRSRRGARPLRGGARARRVPRPAPRARRHDLPAPGPGRRRSRWRTR